MPDPLPTPKLREGCPVAPTPAPCAGDCDGAGGVTIDELLNIVNIALTLAPTSDCPVGNRNGDGQITVDEILVAVNSALNGCE